MQLRESIDAGFTPLKPGDRSGDDGRGAARVYVVDDDRAVRAAVSMLVRTCGWEVVSCGSAEDFLQHYVPGDTHCLVLDLLMPGIGGVALLRELRRRHDELPVIVISAYDDEDEATAALALGARTVLGKPFRDDELVAWVGDALGVGRAREGV